MLTLVAGRTNSSAIVGGEIARSAANAVVGAVSGRLSAAMNMNSVIQLHICLIHLMEMVLEWQLIILLVV